MLFYDTETKMLVHKKYAENIASNLSTGRYAKLTFCKHVDENKIMEEFMETCYYPKYRE